MVRRRLPLKIIANDTSRKRTYRSRKNNLMKKAHEFRTLCGVSTCVIICNPEDHANNKAETYPPDREGVVEVIDKYVSVMRTVGNTKKPLGLSDFLDTQKKKLDNELKKAKEENLNATYPLPPRDLIENILSKEDLESLYEELSVKVMVAKNRQVEIRSSSSTTMMMTSDNNYLGINMNLMESSTRPLVNNFGSNYLNQLGGGGVAWSTSNPAPLHQYPGQDQYAAVSNQTLMMSSIGNPNNNIDYTWFPSALLQDPVVGQTLFCNPMPLAMQTPQWVTEQSTSSSHNNTLHDYYGGPSFLVAPTNTNWSTTDTLRQHGGASGSGVLPPSLSTPPYLPPPAKTEWLMSTTEQSSSSHNTTFIDKFYGV